MPIYCRKCFNCGMEQETLEKMLDSDACACPSCKKKEMVRIISPIAFFIISGYSERNGYTKQGN